MKDPFFLKLGKTIVKWLCLAYSAVIRGTPMMVQALLFKYGCMAMGVNWNNILPRIDVFNGWMVAGLIVITLNTTAYMGEALAIFKVDDIKEFDFRLKSDWNEVRFKE